MQRLALIVLALGLLSLSSGCGLWHGVCGGPYCCDSACGVGPGCCGCGPDGTLANAILTGGCCPEPGPLDFVIGLLDYGCYPCDGCGERYWGECSDPVDCCDPCDRYGCYTGRGRPYEGGPAAVPGMVHEGPVMREGEVIYEGRPRSQVPRPTRVSTANVQPRYVGSPKIISVTDEVATPASPSTSVARTAATRRIQ